MEWALPAEARLVLVNDINIKKARRRPIPKRFGMGLWRAKVGPVPIRSGRPPDYESPLFDILSDPKKSNYLCYLHH
jgi:hypothetical protein